MDADRQQLGKLLLDAKLVSREMLDVALAQQKKDGRRLGVLLVEKGYVSEIQLTQTLSHQLSVPWVSLRHVEFTRQLLNLISQDIAERYGLIPVYVRQTRDEGPTVYVAMEDPTNAEGVRACEKYCGLKVKRMIAPPTEIKHAISAYYARDPESLRILSNLPLMAAQVSEATADSNETMDAIEDENEETEDLLMETIPAPKETVRKPIQMTLLDGTTISIPAKARVSEYSTSDEANADVPTARDIVTALKAIAHGADAREVLGDQGMESVMAALLTVLLKKQVILDWELVSELKRM